MVHRSSSVVQTLAFVACLGAVGACKSDSLMVTFPTGTYVPGPPSGSQATTQTIVVTPPATTTFEAGETYSWHVDLTAVTEINVTAVIVYVETWEDGAWLVNVGADELAAGGVDIPTDVESSDGQDPCGAEYAGVGPCSEELTTGTTDFGFAPAEQTTSTGGAGLSWGEPVEVPVVAADPKADSPLPAQCTDMASPGGACSTWQACCTSGATNSCYYLINGSTKFPCSGSDCTAAAQAVVAYCFP